MHTQIQRVAQIPCVFCCLFFWPILFLIFLIMALLYLNTLKFDCFVFRRLTVVWLDPVCKLFFDINLTLKRSLSVSSKCVLFSKRIFLTDLVPPLVCLFVFILLYFYARYLYAHHIIMYSILFGRRTIPSSSDFRAALVLFGISSMTVSSNTCNAPSAC